MITLTMAFFAGVLATQLPKHAWMHRLASRDAAVARAFAAAALPTPQRQLVEGVPVKGLKPKIPHQWCAEASTSFIINGKQQGPTFPTAYRSEGRCGLWCGCACGGVFSVLYHLPI